MAIEEFLIPRIGNSIYPQLEKDVRTMPSFDLSRLGMAGRFSMPPSQKKMPRAAPFRPRRADA
ncbi:MAG: hypothetical protein M0T84_14665 [Betaproteobacteria bacterium]|nr:hypothetical protein [Betaproteobacteria bacterium]